MEIYVRPILPGALRLQEVQAALAQAMSQEGIRLERELRRTVATWKDKPAIGHKSGVTGREAWVWSGPQGNDKLVRRWVWLDQGTRPHAIRARRARMLRFRTGYRAKTRVRWLGSGPGGAAGPWRSKKAVRHPGTQARKWGQTLIVKESPFFNRRVDSAIARGMEQAWKKR